MYLLLAIFSWFIGWNAMEAFFTIYARRALGIDEGTGTQMLTAFAAALILFAIPSGLIATRFGRKRTILVGLTGMTLGLLAGYFVTQPLVLLIVLAAMGAFWALVNINSLPMVYDLGSMEISRTDRPVLLFLIRRSDHGADTGRVYHRYHRSSFAVPVQCSRNVAGIVQYEPHSHSS